MTNIKPRVLVVEDDDILRDLLSLLLEMEGFDVLTSVNGAEGLAVLQHTTVDVVVLDLMMPVMDGFRFMQVLGSQTPQTQSPLPRVVVLSAAADGDNVAELLLAGVDAAVRKPVDFVELLAHLRALVGGGA